MAALKTPLFPFFRLRASGAAYALFGLTACGGALDSDAVSISGISVSGKTLDCGAAAYAVADVSYRGDVTSSDLGYRWTQTSGSSVTLSGSDSAKVYFTAPASSGTVGLKLAVSANSVSDTANVSFTVSGSSCS